MTRNINFRLWALLISLSLLGVGCVTVERIPEQFPYDAMLSLDDFTGEWIVEAQTYPEIEGAISSHSRTFRYGDAGELSNPFIVHQLTLYASAAEAREAFGSWRERYVEGREMDQKIPAPPHNQTDLSDSRCQRLLVNGRETLSCHWIQQHGRAISYLHAMIDQEVLSLQQFVELIRRTEARLNELVPSDEQSGQHELQGVRWNKPPARSS